MAASLTDAALKSMEAVHRTAHSRPRVHASHPRRAPVPRSSGVRAQHSASSGKGSKETVDSDSILFSHKRHSLAGRVGRRRDWRVSVISAPRSTGTVDDGDDDHSDVEKLEATLDLPSLQKHESSSAPANGASSTTNNGQQAAVLPAAAPAEVAPPTTSPPSTSSRMPEALPETTSYEKESRWGGIKRQSAFQRSLQIWIFLVKFVWKRWIVNKAFYYRNMEGGMSEENKSAALTALAAWVRNRLVSLGPTFIKIGQQFSTRVDVLSKEFIKELEKLQDEVPPFGSQAAVQIVEDQLGCPIKDKFDEFDPEPIAAASLGQVHLARLKGGERVVVKVQRPGLRELFAVDLKKIRVLAKLLQRVDRGADGNARDWVAIYDECSRVLYQEIDYNQEGRNADTFRNNFKDFEWVKVPSIYWDYSGERVLTMEYCPGIKINRVAELDAAGLDRARLARLAVEGYLQQILRMGLFHADPHPGNIAVEAATGRLIYYDFGMMGTLAPGLREGLLKLFYSIYERDAEAALEGLMLMEVLVPTSKDLTAIRRTATFFLDSFYSRLEDQAKQREENEDYGKEFKAQRTKEEKKAKRKEIFAKIGEDLLLVAADQPFRFPATFTFVVRAFTVLDGLGKCLDPSFDITEISRPYARNLLLEDSAKSFSDKLVQDLKQRAQRQNAAFVNLFKGPDRVEAVAGVVARLDDGDLRLRVRALEAERQLARMEVTQAAQTQAILAGAALNLGTVLTLAAAESAVLAAASTAAFAASALFAALGALSFLKSRKLKKTEKAITGSA